MIQIIEELKKENESIKVLNAQKDEDINVKNHYFSNEIELLNQRRKEVNNLLI